MTCSELCGKYRGRVLDNLDPLVLGRLLVAVPQVPGAALTWATPCVPYAGLQVGFHFIPPIGANVWVEFEGGNPSFPIWVGCFWSEGELPLEAPPLLKIIQTDTASIIINDTPGEGGITIVTRDPAVEVPASITMDSLGIQLAVEPSTLSMSPEEGITVVFPTSTVSLTEVGITAETAEIISLTAGAEFNVNATGAATIESVGDVTITAGVAGEFTAGGDLALSAGGAAELSATGDVAVSALGAVEVDALGDLTLAALGVVDIEALDIAITSLGMEITAPGIAITGLAEVTGDLLIDGLQPIAI